MDLPYQEQSLIDRTNFILRTINLQAVVVGVDQIVMTFPVILVRAFEGLFEEKVRGVHYSPSSKFQHEYNCELILRTLEDKFKLAVFQGLTGQSAVAGHLPTIYSIIDFLYEVAKRVDRKKKYEQLDIPGVDDSKLMNYQAIPSYQGLQEFYSLKKQLNGKEDINAVLTRIYHIRKDRTCQDGPVCDQKDTPKKSKKKLKRRRLPPAPPPPETHTPTQAYAPTPPRPKTALPSHVPPVTRSAKQKALQKPQSAPPSRTSPRHPTTRPQTPRQHTTPEAPAALAVSPLRASLPHHTRPAPSPRPSLQPAGAGGGDRMVYDHTTGRRVAVSELRHQEHLRWQKFLQRGHYEHIVTDMNDEYSSDGDEHSGAEIEDVSTKAAWVSPIKNKHDDIRHTDPSVPGLSPTSPGVSGRNAQSIDMFVQKMKKLREGAEVTSPPAKERDTARPLPCYDTMQPLDIIISVEHCVHCELHNKTVRHNAVEYEQRSSDVLRYLVEVLHSSGPCARVGVRRDGAVIDSCSGRHNQRVQGQGHSATDSRLGALEVQVAFRLPCMGNTDSSTSFFSVLLFSKIQTRMWPNKKTLGKKLLSFLQQVGLKSYKSLDSGKRIGFLGEEAIPCYDSSYPVGIVDWTDIALSVDRWTCPLSKDTNKKNDVYWVFNASPLHWVNEQVVVRNTVLPLENDTTGRMHNVPEKYSFLAKVIWAHDENTLLVRPQYLDCEIKCLIQNCSVYNESDGMLLSRDPSRARYEYVTSRSRLPLPLHVVLNFAAEEQVCAWKMLSSKDEMRRVSGMGGETRQELFLSRESFYKQIRELAWLAIRCRPGAEVGFAVDYSSTAVDSEVDVQLAYADIVLDWVFREVEEAAKADDSPSCGCVSIHQLVQWARSGYEYQANLLPRPVAEVTVANDEDAGNPSKREELASCTQSTPTGVAASANQSDKVNEKGELGSAQYGPCQEISDSCSTNALGVVVLRVSAGGPVTPTDANEQKQVNVVVYVEAPGGSEFPHTLSSLYLDKFKYQCVKCVRRLPTVANGRELFDFIFSVRGRNVADIIACGEVKVEFHLVDATSSTCADSDSVTSRIIQIVLAFHD